MKKNKNKKNIKTNLLKINSVAQANYIFKEAYNNYQIGDKVDAAIRKNNGLFIHLKKAGIIVEDTEASRKAIEDTLAKLEEAKKIEEQKKIECEDALKGKLLRDHYNKTLIIRPEIDKEGKFVRELSFESICGKFKDICNLDSVKLKGENKDITKLGDYSFDLLLNEKYDYHLNVSVKERAIKGKAKALGLKSTFVKDNKVILTSGAKSNSSNIEYVVLEDNTPSKRVEEPTFKVPSANDEKITLSTPADKKLTNIDNPTHFHDDKNKKVRMDYLEKKDQLETEYFGKTFNDNLHIQLIYNILDIKKIFSLYIDDISYVLRNLCRGDFTNDMVGTVNCYYDYNAVKNAKDKRFINNLNNCYDDIKDNILYFPQVLSDLYTKRPDKSKKDSNKVNTKHISKEQLEEQKKIELLNILRTLSLCRQYSMHSDDHNHIYHFEDLLDDNIICKDKRLTDVINKVNEVYQKGFDKLHKGLVTKSRKNIYLIMKALGMQDQMDDLAKVKEVFHKYYMLSVCKATSNLGFNLKTIRETILDLAKLQDLMEQNDKAQYYQIINYIINEFITEDFTDNIVKELRLASTEQEKESIYLKYSKNLYNNTELKNILNEDLIKTITDEKRNKKNPKDYFEYFTDEDILTKEDTDLFFVKLVYFVSGFLSIKDTNNLVTSLINKFNNISYFINFIKDVDEDAKKNNRLGFTSNYKIFDSMKFDRFSLDLNLVLNLSKMQKNVNKASKNDNSLKALNESMIKDAILAFGGKDTDLDNLVKTISKATNGNKRKRTASLRNFIYSKIVNANNFRYIAEYSNPKQCLYIIRNKKVVRYVLRQIPVNQLDKYCSSMKIDLEKSIEEKISILTNKLQELNIDFIVSNYDNDIDGITNLTGLYLTVVYRVIKNLVLINSYYSIAFTCLERDCSLYKNELGSNYGVIDLSLVKLFVKKPNKFNKHNQSYINSNSDIFNNIFPDVKKISYNYYYRNNVIHLNAVHDFDKYLSDFKLNTHFEMRSYFELYNYLIQKRFLNDFENSSKNKALPEEILRYEKDINEYSTYSKDLLHILNMPFAYNLARYKNLTIEDIFYDSYLDKYTFK